MANQRCERNGPARRQGEMHPARRQGETHPVCRQERGGAEEPQMRRWPHPVEVRSGEAAPCSQLQYVHCALAYQNQLLADIKALMEQLAQREGQKGV